MIDASTCSCFPWTHMRQLPSCSFGLYAYIVYHICIVFQVQIHTYIYIISLFILYIYICTLGTSWVSICFLMENIEGIFLAQPVSQLATCNLQMTFSLNDVGWSQHMRRQRKKCPEALQCRCQIPFTWPTWITPGTKTWFLGWYFI